MLFLTKHNYTMKHIVVAVAATLMVCVAGLQFFNEKTTSTLPLLPSNDMEKMIRGNKAILTAVQAEIRDIRSQLAKEGELLQPQELVDTSEEYGDIINRLATVEEAVEELVSVGVAREAYRGESKHKILADNLGTGVDIDMSLPTSFDESDFDADEGVPLGDVPEVLDGAIHELSGMEVHNMECKNTFCKVTYSALNSPENESGNSIESNLMDKLVANTEGQTLDIRYAKDSYGNKVMYIQRQ